MSIIEAVWKPDEAVATAAAAEEPSSPVGAKQEAAPANATGEIQKEQDDKRGATPALNKDGDTQVEETK